VISGVVAVVCVQDIEAGGNVLVRVILNGKASNLEEEGFVAIGICTIDPWLDFKP
jgi:hypothetical protein